MATPESRIARLFRLNGNESTRELPKFFEDMGVAGGIRVPSSQFARIGAYGPERQYMHFNLKNSTQVPGASYLILDIVKQGQKARDGQPEVLPQISFEEAWIAECLEVGNDIPYEDLEERHFKTSMQGVRTPAELKQAIVEGYQASTGLSEEEIISQGVGFTSLQMVGRIYNGVPRFYVSPETGFDKIPTESVSSQVFARKFGGKVRVFKLNKRNSIERHRSDYQALQEGLGAYADHLPNSHITEAEYAGETYNCVIQDRIDGVEVKYLPPEQKMEVFRRNKGFLLRLTEMYLEAVEAKTLYPDIIGSPPDHNFLDSINLIAEMETGKVWLCDIGRSPQMDTLRALGSAYFSSERQANYDKNVREFRELLLSL